jgi:hypothetical protein
VAVPLAVFEEELQSRGFAFEGTTQATDEFRGKRLKNQAVTVFEKGDLGALADAVAAAEFGGDDELAFGGDGGDIGFHGAPRSKTTSISITKRIL